MIRPPRGTRPRGGRPFLRRLPCESFRSSSIRAKSRLRRKQEIPELRGPDSVVGHARVEVRRMWRGPRGRVRGEHERVGVVLVPRVRALPVPPSGPRGARPDVVRDHFLGEPSGAALRSLSDGAVAAQAPEVAGGAASLETVRVLTRSGGTNTRPVSSGCDPTATRLARSDGEPGGARTRPPRVPPRIGSAIFPLRMR